MPPPGAFPGTLHRYTKRLVAFEHTPPSLSTLLINTLLFVPGLTDGLLTIPYPHTLSQHLPSTWSLVEVHMSSSYKGFATGSLARDARELSSCVSYFNSLRPGGKIVLMGHSTGCQDIMEYLVGAGADTRPAISGAILQGGVSDREAWAHVLGTDETAQAELAALIAAAESAIAAGQGKEIMSLTANPLAAALGTSLTAYRTHSLLAPGGDDDYFSTSLPSSTLARTFGAIPARTPLCFLLGSLDPYVPPETDKAALLARWTRVVREGAGVVDDVDGGVVEGAHHNLDGDPEEVVTDLVKRVCGFIEGLDKGNDWGGAGARL